MKFFIKELTLIVANLATFLCTLLFAPIELSFDNINVLYTTKLIVFTLCITNFLVLSAIKTRVASADVIKNTLSSFLYWALCIMFFHVVAVLMGAPAFETCAETFHFATLLSTCAVLPCCLAVDTDPDALIVLFTRNKSAPGLESVVKFSSIGSLLGAWLGAFPIPLDWDRPWQVWPISCMIGTVAGYFLGAIAGLLYSIVISQPIKKRL